MTVLPSDDLFDSATLLARDPGAARRTAERTLASRPGPAARAEATRLLGLCLYEQGDTAGAERVLRRAAAIGAAAGQHRAVERARRARLAIRSQHGGPGLSGPRLGGSASPRPRSCSASGSTTPSGAGSPPRPRSSARP
ncbi:tetratricopeptide repeat protein [Nocardiopsis composta]